MCDLHQEKKIGVEFIGDSAKNPLNMHLSVVKNLSGYNLQRLQVRLETFFLTQRESCHAKCFLNFSNFIEDDKRTGICSSPCASLIISIWLRGCFICH